MIRHSNPFHLESQSIGKIDKQNTIHPENSSANKETSEETTLNSTVIQILPTPRRRKQVHQKLIQDDPDVQLVKVKPEDLIKNPPPLVKIFLCKICPKAYTKRLSLKSHTRLHRLKGQTAQFKLKPKPSASKYFKSVSVKPLKRKRPKSKMSRNVSVSKSKVEASFSGACPHCPKIFLWPSHLKNHLKSHTVERVECPLCHETYKSGSLQSHMWKYHKDEPSRPRSQGQEIPLVNVNTKEDEAMNTNADKIPSPKPEKLHECPHCQKKFTIQCNMKTHISSGRCRGLNKPSPPPKPKPDKLFTCRVCLKEFSNGGLFKVHVKTHKIQCFVQGCTKEYNCKRAFKRHQLKFHTQDKGDQSKEQKISEFMVVIPPSPATPSPNSGNEIEPDADADAEINQSGDNVEKNDQSVLVHEDCCNPESQIINENYNDPNKSMANTKSSDSESASAANSKKSELHVGNTTEADHNENLSEDIQKDSEPAIPIPNALHKTNENSNNILPTATCPEENSESVPDPDPIPVLTEKPKVKLGRQFPRNIPKSEEMPTQTTSEENRRSTRLRKTPSSLSLNSLNSEENLFTSTPAKRRCSTRISMREREREQSVAKVKTVTDEAENLKQEESQVLLKQESTETMEVLKNSDTPVKMKTINEILESEENANTAVAEIISTISGTCTEEEDHILISKIPVSVVADPNFENDSESEILIKTETEPKVIDEVERLRQWASFLKVLGDVNCRNRENA